MIIDCSFWNGLFDWTKAKLAGVMAAYIKASQGIWKDAKWDHNKANCSVFYKGGYHFLDYANYVRGNEIEWGKAQARFFWNLVKDWQTLPGCLDIESNEAQTSWGKITPSNIGRVLKIALAFVNEYKLLSGHYPVIYTNLNLSKMNELTITGYKYAFRNFTSCPLWIARYANVNDPLVDSFTGERSAWSSYVLWQYSSVGDGLLYGNEAGNSKIDLNRLGKPIAEWALTNPPVSEDEPTLTIEQRLDRIEKLLNIT